MLIYSKEYGSGMISRDGVILVFLIPELIWWHLLLMEIIGQFNVNVTRKVQL